MSREVTRQAQSVRKLVDDWPLEAAARLRTAVRAFGKQDDVAKLVPMARQRLSGVLTGAITPSEIALNRICEVVGVSRDEIFGLESPKDTDGSVKADIVAIDALNIEASAGDGSIAVGERLAPGPFHFARDWLRAKFGSIANLRLVRIKGTSQEPDLHDGDWVLIDQSLNAVEDGLAVLVLDDCLMIKRLQRAGRTLRLVSKNEQYPAIELDLKQDEDRLRVIGRAVFVLKAA